MDLPKLELEYFFLLRLFHVVRLLTQRSRHIWCRRRHVLFRTKFATCGMRGSAESVSSMTSSATEPTVRVRTGPQSPREYPPRTPSDVLRWPRGPLLFDRRVSTRASATSQPMAQHQVRASFTATSCRRTSW